MDRLIDTITCQEMLSFNIGHLVSYEGNKEKPNTFTHRKAGCARKNDQVKTADGRKSNAVSTIT